VRYLLTSPSLAGLRSHRDRDGQLHTVPATWPALIEVDHWRQVQQVLGQPSLVVGTNGNTYSVRTQPKAQPRKYLLSGGRRRSGVTGQPGELYGVLRCGKCDGPLIAQTQSRRTTNDAGTPIRVPAYSCHTNVDGCGGVSISPAYDVDALVVEAIQRRLAESPQLRQRLDAAQDADAARWRGERDAAKARMLDAATLYGSRAIDKDTFAAMHEPAKRDHDVAERHLAAMVTDTTLPSSVEVQEAWDELTLKQQRAVVERLIGRIDVAPAQGGQVGFDASRVGTPQWLA
jgi:hypothetical protein